MSDMSIMKLSEENGILRKSIGKLEDEGMEARKAIRLLQRQLKSPLPNVVKKAKATQTVEEVRKVYTPPVYLLPLCSLERT